MFMTYYKILRIFLKMYRKIGPHFLGIFTSKIILQISMVVHSEANLNQSEPI